MNTTEVRTAEEYRYFQEHGVFPPPKPVTAKKKLKEEDVDEIYWELLEAVKEKKAIFIPGNVPSSKNSKEIQQVYTGRSDCCNAPYTKLGGGNYICTKCDCSCNLGKRPILSHSKTVKKYMEEQTHEYIKAKSIFESWSFPSPTWMGLYFIRDSSRRFDGINAAQIVFDMFVENKLITDDNMDYIRHVDLGFHKDKNRPGVIIVPLLNFKEKRNQLW